MNKLVGYIRSDGYHGESVSTQRLRIEHFAKLMGMNVVRYYIDRDPIKDYGDPGVHRLKAAMRVSLREGWPLVAETARNFQFNWAPGLYEWFVKAGGQAWGVSDEFGVTDPAMREMLAPLRIHLDERKLAYFFLDPDTPLDDAEFRLQFMRARDTGAANDLRVANCLTIRGFVTTEMLRWSPYRVGETRRRLMRAEIVELHQRLIVEAESSRGNWLHRVGQSLRVSTAASVARSPQSLAAAARRRVCMSWRSNLRISPNRRATSQKSMMT